MDSPPLLAPLSTSNQRIPALFVPSAEQASRLQTLLNHNQAAYGRLLAAATEFGLPCGPSKPPQMSTARLSRNLHELHRLITLTEQILRTEPGVQQAIEQAATEDGAPPGGAERLALLSTEALTDIATIARQAAERVTVRRGRKADPDKTALVSLMQKIVAICADAGVHVSRTSRPLHEITGIIFELLCIEHTTVDRSIRDLQDVWRKRREALRQQRGIKRVVSGAKRQ